MLNPFLDKNISIYGYPKILFIYPKVLTNIIFKTVFYGISRFGESLYKTLEQRPNLTVGTLIFSPSFFSLQFLAI